MGVRVAVVAADRDETKKKETTALVSPVPPGRFISGRVKLTAVALFPLCRLGVFFYHTNQSGAKRPADF